MTSLVDKYLNPGRVRQRLRRDLVLHDEETGLEVSLAKVSDDPTDVEISNEPDRPLVSELRHFLCLVPWERISLQVSEGEAPLYRIHVQPQAETLRDVADMIDQRGHVDSALAALQSGSRPNWLERDSYDEIISQLVSLGQALSQKIEKSIREASANASE
jgi:hypothetical protein